MSAHPDIRAYLQIRAASSPHWIDGGERLAFLTNITGIPQVWTIDRQGGWPDQLTYSHERVSGLRADAQARTLVVSRDSGGNERHGIHRALPGPETALVDDPDVIHRAGAFSPDGRLLAFTHTARNGVDFDLAALDVTTGERRELVQLDGWTSAVDWGAAGILILRARSNFDMDLLLVDPATGVVRDAAPHDGEAQYLAATLGDDGTILCITDAGSEFTRIAEIDATGAVRFLTPDEHDVDDLAVRGARRAWAVNDEGYGRVFIDGVQVDALPEGVPSGLTWSPDGRTLALTLGRPNAPHDIWICDADGPRQLTRSALGGVEPAKLRRPALAHVASFDGLPVPYLLYGPSDAPTLCWIHGGPESQSRPELNSIIQYLVASGLSVAVPNVRGSTGYGRRYHHLDDVEKRLDSVADLAALARALGAERGVPVGVMGGSYGGFMTLSAITEHPELWSAAVDIVGIASFVSFLEHTGAYRRRLREAEYGSLEQNREFLVRASPLTNVERIHTPLMVIHGANDPRVPVGEAEQIVAAVRRQGGEVEYLRYEDEGHGLVRLPNRIDAYPRVAAFLERHLLGR